MQSEDNDSLSRESDGIYWVPSDTNLNKGERYESNIEVLDPEKPLNRKSILSRKRSNTRIYK